MMLDARQAVLSATGEKEGDTHSNQWVDGDCDPAYVL